MRVRLSLAYSFEKQARSNSMCEKCDLIDQTILRYQRLKIQVGDEELLDTADRLVQELKVKKQKLHPEAGDDGRIIRSCGASDQ